MTERSANKKQALLLLIFNVSVLALSAQAAVPRPDDSLQCKNACVCSGTDAQAMSVQGKAVQQCVQFGQPVELKHVTVFGDIDLSAIPPTRLRREASRAIAGLDKPRELLELNALERDLGVLVDSAIVVRAPITIVEKSEIHGRLIGARGPTGDRIRRPLVFIGSVILEGSTFRESVDLSSSRFRNPVSLDGSVFTKGVSFRYSRFDDNALFSRMHSDGETNFANTRFERDAFFTGLSIGKGGSAEFGRSRFFRDAAFGNDDKGVKTVLRAVNFGESEFLGAQADFRDAELYDANFTKMHASAAVRFDRAHFAGSRKVAFTQASLASDVTFDETRFDVPVTFLAASFSGGRPVSFDRATFRGSLEFNQARFSGPVSLVDARASDKVSFDDAEVRDTLDVRHSTITALSLGGPFARARIGGNALFDYAQIGWAVFDNTDFIGRASFVATTFGSAGDCRRDAGIVVSMANVLFSGSTDFSDATFLGPVNLAHVSAETGKVQWRWSQLEGKLRALKGATLKENSQIPRCFRIETDPVAEPKDVQRGRAAAAGTLRWIERNFKTQESMDDAAKATYARETAESVYAVNDENNSSTARAVAHGRWGTWGWLFGFGVKPGRILAELLVVLIAAALIYGLSKREMGSDPENDSLIEWMSTSYPWRFSGSMYPLEGERALLAVWVSLAALTTIKVKGAYIVLRQNDWLHWVVLIERCAGSLLLLVLAISLASTMPVLHKLLAWLPGF